MRQQECCGYCENCTTIGLRLARLESMSFSKNHSPGETRWKKSWDRFEEYDSLSLRYVKQVSGKRNDHRLEKDKSNLLISEVPTLWILRTGSMKRLPDKSDALEAGLGILPKTYTSSKSICQSYASSRNSRGSFLGKTLRRSWVHVSLERLSKTTSHQKGQENWLQYCKLCSPWFMSEFFLYNAQLTSSSSSSQDSVFDVSRYTENPVPERSGSTSEELRRNPMHKPTQTDNEIQNEGREEVQSDLQHELPDWLQAMNVVLLSHWETLSLDMETLPVLLANYQWTR